MAQNPLAPWRDAALVLLVVQSFVLGLLPLVAVYFLTRGMRWVLAQSRMVLGKANEIARSGNGIVGVACGRIVAPFIAGQSWLAGVQATLRGLASRFGRSDH